MSAASIECVICKKLKWIAEFSEDMERIVARAVCDECRETLLPKVLEEGWKVVYKKRGIKIT